MDDVLEAISVYRYCTQNGRRSPYQWYSNQPTHDVMDDNLNDLARTHDD